MNDNAESNNKSQDTPERILLSTADFLKPLGNRHSKALNLSTDSEQVIEPFDADAAAENLSGQPFADENAAEQFDAGQQDISPDEFIDRLYSQTQTDIFSSFDSLKDECRLFVPDSDAQAVAQPERSDIPQDTQPQIFSGESLDSAPSTTQPAATQKAFSFSQAVQAAMAAEGGYTDEEPNIFENENSDSGTGGFNVSFDDIEYGDEPEPSYQSAPVSTRQPVQRPVNNEPAEPAKNRKDTTSTAKKGGKKKKKKSFFANLLPSGTDSVPAIFNKVLFLVAVCTMLVCFGILGNTYLLEPFLQKRSADDLSELRVEAVGSWEELNSKYSDVTFPEDIRLDLAEFYAINKDFYGYLEIDGTELSMPIVTGRGSTNNNNYYLKHNFSGEWTKYGCPFVNVNNSDSIALDRNTTVFGHNMEYDDLVFGQLVKYLKLDGFKKSPLIELETLYNKYTFKVYAVFLSSARPDSNGYFFDYTFTELHGDNFSTTGGNDVFKEYIAQIDQRKLYSTGVDIKESDKIITLSTCYYDFTDERLVVVGRLVREGEDTAVDTSLAVQNPSPRYPTEWYSVKGKTNPYASASKWIPH